MFEFLRWGLGLLVGAILGWSGSAWYHGLSITPWLAATEAQSAVTTAVTATQGIDASARSAAAAKERVRLVIREVPVAAWRSSN